MDDQITNDQVRYFEWDEEKTAEAEAILEEEGQHVQSDMQYKRLDIDAKRNWDNYYKNNTTNGYKDRHYIHREFEELSHKLE
jgi:methyltransferase-like protein 6